MAGQTNNCVEMLSLIGAPEEFSDTVSPEYCRGSYLPKPVLI